MNYFKISFPPELNSGNLEFQLFKKGVELRHRNNAWSADTLPFWLVASPQTSSQFVQGLGISPEENSLQNLFDKGLSIDLLDNYEVLPEDAQAWLDNMKQAVQRLADFL